MKKLLISFLCILLSVCCFSQEKENVKQSSQMDFDFKIYLPSLLGHVTGNNSFLGLRENTDSVDDCTNFMVETRFSIFSLKNITFSGSFGVGAYIENNKIHDNDLLSIDLSLGTGIYLHLFDSPTFPLNGLCVYLYPLYQIPVYTQGYESYLKWKSSFDIGYNLTLLNCITVYPYIRNIIGWNSNDIRYGFDCGFAIGIYFKDIKQ